MHLEQGRESVKTAFARRGEQLTLKPSDDSFYIVRAGGAAFFSLTLTEPNKPRQRRLLEKGLVELSSAAGHFWQRGYVFVDDHPYYARTDEQGRFAIDQVPIGNYQVVCWLPNWKVRRIERDTETGLIRHVMFGQPLELDQTVNVLPEAEPTLQFRIELNMFRP
jgi:hypothetical protein